eukprot:2252227-Prymnesium_polylepis.1
MLPPCFTHVSWLQATHTATHPSVPPILLLVSHSPTGGYVPACPDGAPCLPACPVAWGGARTLCVQCGAPCSARAHVA